MNALERFWSKVVKQTEVTSPHVVTPCWLWIGGTRRKGYGVFCAGYDRLPAHKWIFLQLKGEVPTGLLVCHHCDNPACVNPDHLFLDTNRGNLLDMARKGRHHMQQRTHCKNGHPFTQENTYIYNGWRHCKKCNYAASQKSKQAQRTAILDSGK